ncbi:MAG: hypothetical protein J7M13_04805 [Synergistetes bacterium]|nr:hypothetical protein [Synergistota bacterium]
MTLKEKVAYIKGFIKGGGINEENLAQIIGLIVDALDEISSAIEELERTQLDLEEYVESIDDDLASLEKDLLGEEKELGLEEEFEEVECPHCGEMFLVPEKDFFSEEEIRCPACGKLIASEEGESANGDGK